LFSPFVADVLRDRELRWPGIIPVRIRKKTERNKITGFLVIG